ncbi:MAG: alkaline phosphatase family protein [Promethearchaeota archaeon]
MVENSILLTFMIDSLRYDYIERYQPAFLKKISKRGYKIRISEPLMFATQSAFFAGLYPDQSNLATQFWFEPENSPFKFLKILPLNMLDFISKKIRYFDFGLRFIIKIIARKIESLKGNTESSHIDTRSIPLKFLPYFTFVKKKYIFEDKAYNFKTLFNYLKEQNHEWIFLAYPTHQNLTVNGIRNAFWNFKRKDDIKFLFFQFGEIDWIGHKNGPESPLIGYKLKKIDMVIKEIYNYYIGRGKNTKIIVFGDHGMVPVKYNVDIIRFFQRNGIYFSKHDRYFIDSILFRFWSYNKKRVIQVEKALKNVSFGQLITKDIAKLKHFNFKHNRYGDLMFLANPEVIFFPNFYQNRNKVKGMHGYGKSCNLNDTELIIFEKKIKDKFTLSKNNHDLTDIFYLFLILLDLDTNFSVEMQKKNKILHPIS